MLAASFASMPCACGSPPSAADSGSPVPGALPGTGECWQHADPIRRISYPQFVSLAAGLGLRFDLSAELPDVILADLTKPIRFIFCEIVATDGAVTEPRKAALLEVVKDSKIAPDQVHFLTAFEDRESAPLRKFFSQLSKNSLIWFRTEPELIVALSTRNRLGRSADHESSAGSR